MKRPSTIDFLILAGPTASGKSGLAIELAQAWNGEIINADSMQVYKDLSILTARPQLKEQVVPHHLYGVLEAHENGSAAWWVEQACAFIKECIARGRFPIVVGGTGLYLHALTEGLSPIPDIAPSIREQVRKRSLEDANDFAEFVYNLDPLTRENIRPTDIQRLSRALEVFLQTGVSLTTWQKIKPTPAHSYHYEYVVIEPERNHLYGAINERFQFMVENGAVEEVKRLVQLNLSLTCPIIKAIGVREIIAYLEGILTLEEAIEQAQKKSRQYAKRQTTWFRHQPLKKRVIYKPDIATLVAEFCNL